MAIHMWERLKNELKSPLTVTGWVCGVIGLIWGVYTWYAAQQKAEITYRAEQVQVVDVNRLATITPSPGGASATFADHPFKVLDANGNPITQNIYAANITIWNSGDIDLGHDRIRRPISISFGSSSTILDANIEFASDGNVSEFFILKDPTRGETLNVSWKFFDPNSGFRAKIIYTSDTKSSITMNGSIYGVKEFRNKSDSEELNIPADSYLKGRYDVVIKSLIFVCATTSFALFLPIFLKWKLEAKIRSNAFIQGNISATIDNINAAKLIMVIILVSAIPITAFTMLYIKANALPPF